MQIFGYGYIPVGPDPSLLALIHQSADLFNSKQELGSMQPLSF
jgi:hypothetical protein